MEQLNILFCISSKVSNEKEKLIPKTKKTEKIIEHEGELYVKNTNTERKLDLGFKLKKISSFFEVKTESGLKVLKNRNYKKLGKTLANIVEEEKDNIKEEKEEDIDIN